MNIHIEIDLTTEQVMKAISIGVERAIYDVARNATDMPCSDFYESIKKVIKEAIKESSKYPWEDS